MAQNSKQKDIVQKIFNFGVMLNCIPSMFKAVFGLICEFNVIVIVDFAKFYCNAFIIAKP